VHRDASPLYQLQQHPGASQWPQHQSARLRPQLQEQQQQQVRNSPYASVLHPCTILIYTSVVLENNSCRLTQTCFVYAGAAAATSRPPSARRSLQGKEARRVSASTGVSASSSQQHGARTEPPVTRSRSRIGLGMVSPVPENKAKYGRCVDTVVVCEPVLWDIKWVAEGMAAQRTMSEATVMTCCTGVSGPPRQSEDASAGHARIITARRCLAVTHANMSL
jgi:hypothetical protein